MALDWLKAKGTPLDRQRFTWRELSPEPYSKLDDDAFTRVRVIFMNGVESESVRFSHAAARMNRALQIPLAQIRRVEHHQQTMVNWLNPPDQSPLETTLGFEQVAIEITAAVAQKEPDAYLAQGYRFGLLEDFDHLYRFSALMDRVEGKDANNIIQSYTDIIPGRPTSVEHRAPEDDVRNPYDKLKADVRTKLHAQLIIAAEHQVHDYYMNIGPIFSDPVARQLYAEIASIEEQHVTHYESFMDPEETWLEKWLIHEATEVYCYWSCVESEGNPRIKAIWERFLDYELGHLQAVGELFKQIARRDIAEVLPERIPEPLQFKSQRDFIREVLAKEASLRAVGTQFVPREAEPADGASALYRTQLNSQGSPSELVAAGWKWRPGLEVGVLGTNGYSLEHRRLQ